MYTIKYLVHVKRTGDAVILTVSQQHKKLLGNCVFSCSHLAVLAGAEEEAVVAETSSAVGPMTSEAVGVEAAVETMTEAAPVAGKTLLEAAAEEAEVGVTGASIPMTETKAAGAEAGVVPLKRPSAVATVGVVQGPIPSLMPSPMWAAAAAAAAWPRPTEELAAADVGEEEWLPVISLQSNRESGSTREEEEAAADGPYSLRSRDS